MLSDEMRRRHIAVLFAFLFGANAGAAVSRARTPLQREWFLVQRSVYDSLERAPVRHWGREALQEPLRRVGRLLTQTAAKPDAVRLRRDADEAYKAILRELMLRPVGTVSPGPDGSPRLEPEALEIVLLRNVPSALVLRVEPFGREGKLKLTPVAGEGLRSEAQEVALTKHFVTYAVVPIVATGEPGKHKASLRIIADGKEAAVPLSVEVRPSGRLEGTVVRKGDRAPLAAKLFVEDEQGRLFVVPGERNYRTQSWYAFFQPRFSYVERAFAIPLPPGTYRVTAMKGYGYRNSERLVEIAPGKTTACGLELEQLRELEKDGWFCGDMHVHHRGLTLAMLRAEDVNVAANCHYSSHKPMRLPVYKDSSDATHLACSAQEIEHWNFGNAFYFAIPTTVQDPETPDPRMTPFFHYDRQCHGMGGICLRYLRSRPFSPKGGGQQQPELAVDAALGLIDAWSVMDNSMQNTLDQPRARWTGDGWRRGWLYEHTYKTWYALLNCGIRIAASAGTSYGRLSRLGFNRVYARCPDGFGVNGFAQALKRGDGFVTNGPLLWFRVDGRLPGDGLALDAPGQVKAALELHCRHPVDLVEILRNGRVVAREKLEAFDGHYTWEGPLAVPEPSWLAARCFGTHTPRYPHAASHNHFAHTSPLVVTVGGRRPASAKDAARFLREIDALIAFAPNIPTEKLRARSLAAFGKARDYFARMAVAR